MKESIIQKRSFWVHLIHIFVFGTLFLFVFNMNFMCCLNMMGLGYWGVLDARDA